MSGTTATVLTVTVPLPPTELRKNAHVGWRRKAAATKQARRDAYFATVAADPEVSLWDPDAARLDVTIRWNATHRVDMDPANVWHWLAGTVDGIADAMGVDDKRFIPGTVTQERDETGRGEVVVTITEVEE